MWKLSGPGVEKDRGSWRLPRLFHQRARTATKSLLTRATPGWYTSIVFDHPYNPFDPSRRQPRVDCFNSRPPISSSSSSSSRTSVERQRGRDAQRVCMHTPSNWRIADRGGWDKTSTVKNREGGCTQPPCTQQAGQIYVSFDVAEQSL